jgi:NAD kinase
MRPLVIQDDVSVCLKVTRGAESVLATFDGQEAEPVQPGDVLEITRAKGRLMLVKPPRDYFSILHAKLKWGQR